MKYKIIMALLLLSAPMQVFAIANTGTYIGNGTQNRQILHNLGTLPDYVYIVEYDDSALSGDNCSILAPVPTVAIHRGTAPYTVTAMDSDYFYIGSANSNASLCNSTTTSGTFIDSFEWYAVAGSDSSVTATTDNSVQPETFATILFVSSCAMLLYFFVFTIRKFKKGRGRP